MKAGYMGLVFIFCGDNSRKLKFFERVNVKGFYVEFLRVVVKKGAPDYEF